MFANLVSSKKGIEIVFSYSYSMVLFIIFYFYGDFSIMIWKVSEFLYKKSLAAACCLGKALFAVCLVFVWPVHSVYGQTWDWESFIERVTADEESEYTAWAYLYDELCELHEHPLDINAVTKEQLEQFPFLTPVQIENLLAYLYSYGPMQTLGELQLVGEMDYETRQMLSFFVYVGSTEKRNKPLSLKNVFRYGRHELITRMDIPLYERAGYKEYSDSILQRYPNRKYAGDPYYHSLRYQFRYGNKVFAGLTAEKDPGEPFFASGKKGYDFYSFYIMLKDIGRLKSLVVGNYRLNFGQGLVMNTDFSLGKITALSSVNSLNKGIRKHSSTSEDNYFRGVAAAYRIGKLTVTGFYSDKKQDATLKQDSAVMPEPFITSFKTDGYHRTPLERSKKNNVSNRLAGGNLTYSGGGLHWGVTGVYNAFDKLLNPSNEAYKKYYARGKEFYAYGTDYSYFHSRFTIAGETAYCKGGGVATMNSFQFKLADDCKLTLLQRYYSKDYNALYANSFSESGSVQNESGIYVGMEAAPWKNVKLNGYFDVFRFPYLKYQASVPSSKGIDGMLQAVWTPGRKTSFLVKYRYKNKGKDFTLKETKKKGIDRQARHTFRAEWQYLLAEEIELKTAFDYTRVDFVEQNNDCGYMFTQSAAYIPASFPLSMDLTAAYFHTDSYDSRIYRYEKGLLYAFSFPSFYYEGIRLAFRLRWEIGSRFSLTAKYGGTRYLNRETISSGTQEIDGNLKQDIQLQLKVKF